ncbi:hypothetical protein RDMS_01635 [Deinococcus sp. RL]|uniref:hypothetical protein n=1 Tax=Deinococcus sp. RL TaxID=1489678 RepID=UPI0004D3D36E|nr:hypothetical protein [Deinococcus sp. RL]KEF35483.1 hypothetical protein RDMS_01635 [Deinococcus sp. RL]
MEDVQKLLTALLSLRDRKDPSARALTDAKRWAFARGDYVGENYAYWTGLIPKSEEAKTEWAKTIVTEDVIGPCLNRIVGGMLGRDWEWTLCVGGDEALTPDEERVAALTVWHREADAWGALKELAYGVLALGRGSLRVYIPAAYAEEAEQGRVTDLAAALERIHVMFVPAAPSADLGDGGAIRDEYGREVGYFYRYAYTPPGETKSETRIEVHTPQEVGVFKLEGGKFEAVGQTVPNPLYDPALSRRPRFLMLEVSRDGGSTITQSAADLASDLCVTLTNRRRNSDLGGHRQYVTIDAQDPEDEQGNPMPYTFGPRSVASIKSVTVDAAGMALQSPMKASVQVFDPVQPAVFLEHAADTRRSLHAHFDQLWALVGESNLSGESRRESRMTFDMRLRTEAEPLNRAAKWLIETVLRLAAAMLGKPALAEGVTCQPQLFLNTTPTDMATFTELRNAHLAGQYPLEALLEQTPGVVDVAQTLAQLEAERASNVKLAAELLAVGAIPRPVMYGVAQRAGYPITSEQIAAAEEMETLGLPAEGGEDGGDTEADVPSA